MPAPIRLPTPKPRTSRRKLMIWRLVKGSVIALVVSPFIPVVPPLGYVGGLFNSFYYWKNPGWGGAGTAVSRELKLNTDNYNAVPYFVSRRLDFKRKPWCKPEDIKKHQPGEPSECIVVGGDLGSGRCNTFIVDFGCSAIRVPGGLWRDQRLRKRIIHASLHPCSYLYDPATGVVKERHVLDQGEITEFDTRPLTLEYHELKWRDSLCQNHRLLLVAGIPLIKIPFFPPRSEPRTVYISIEDENTRATDTLAVYKAERTGDVVTGGYFVGTIDD